MRHSVRLSGASKASTILLTAALAVGCTSPGETIPEQTLDEPVRRPLLASPTPLLPPSGLTLGQGRRAPVPATIVRGAGPPREASAAGFGPPAAASDGGYVLNFEAVEIRDVVKAVLADMLGIAYVIDPAVQGTLTLHTARPLPREAVLPAFEEALKLSGVALVAGAVGYQVLPLQGAARLAPVGGRRGAGVGYRVVLVPLRYAAAADIQRVLEPIVPAGTVAQADPERNILMLAGTEADVSRAQRTISLFDVDWLRSLSYGLFPLQYTPAKTVATDLEAVVGGKGPLAGRVRITAIEHLNAILVAAPRLADVTATRTWIERFDRGRDQTTPRLFVYRVQNGRAQDLARTLTASLGRPGAGAGGSTSQPPDDAPPTPDGIGSPAPATRLRTAGGGGLAQAPGPIPSVLLGNIPGGDSAAQPGSPGDMRITADESNNALLIVTTPERYQQVEAALGQLDIVPLQVMLEASIAEVNLTNQLRYGIQYYFRSGNVSGLASGVAAASLGPSTGGLSLAILKGADIGAVLDLLSSITRIRVISAPKLVVLNNRTASLQVGDQVPIATASAVGVVTNNAPIVNTIQLLDTGIILRITPRVNQSGLVLLDLAQEVSASVPTSSSGINSPTIQQRRVTTSVAVQDGQTVAIGGLIRDSRNRGRTGIPLLKDLPGVGFLFGQTNDQVDRTELIVLITPHVIRDAQGADAATDELRAKLPLVRAFNAAAPR